MKSHFGFILQLSSKRFYFLSHYTLKLMWRILTNFRYKNSSFSLRKKIMKLNQDKNSQKNMLLQQKKLEKYEGVIWKLFCFFVTVTLFYSSRLNSERLGVLSEIRLNRNRLPKIAFLVTELIECKSNFQNFTVQVLSIGAKTLPIIFSSLLGHGEACWKCFWWIF